MVHTINEKLSPILDDQPASKDLLDFESYVQALKELIAHDKTRTPLTLGIFGRWGMGKTTLMKMLEKNLDKEGITTIWFNAWQYGHEDELWAAFLQSMLNKVQNSLGAFRLLVFKTKLFSKRIRWNEVPQSLIAYLFRFVVALLPILLIDPVSNQIAPEAKPILDIGGSLATLVLSIWIVGKPLFDSIQKHVSINISDFQKTSNYQEHIAFLDQFRDHFSDIVKSLPKRGEKRLAVFIDDLDRCSPDRTIQVLDAIKLFVDVEGCVYVLGLDVDVVQKAVATKYKDDPIAQQEYMSKIIQLPFQLPPLTRDEMQEFLKQLSFDLPDPNCQNVFITGLVVNPREVKRTINIFSLLWNLASKRAELTGKITPVRLAKVVVIQQTYPELHRILLYRPYLLIELEKFFRQQEKAKNMATPPGELGVDMNTEQVRQENQVADLPSDVLSFAQTESLRNMLLLHNLSDSSEEVTKDEYSFANLKPEDVAVYFTLTSRAEAPKPDIADTAFDAEDVTSVGEPPTSNLSKKLIGRRYKIEQEIGRGALATTYLAFDIRLGIKVTIKVLSSGSSDDVSSRRFLREVEAMAKLSHPNIAQIHNFGKIGKRLYFVTPYLSGGTLEARLTNPIPFNNAARILVPIAKALAYAHQQGFVHRDVKPSNILFTDSGEPVLSDFGIMKSLKDTISFRTEEGFFVGTPLYAAPEQWEGKGNFQSDIYSLGVVFYQMITGRIPYDTNLTKRLTNSYPEKPSLYIPGLPDIVDQVTIHATARNLEQRYSSMDLFVADLEELATGVTKVNRAEKR